MVENISVGELSRDVARVLQRFEALATRLDESYVTKQIHDLYSKGMDKSISDLQRSITNLASKETVEAKVDKQEGENIRASVIALEARIKKLEENVQWVVRIVLTFVILAILGAIFVANGIPT